MSLISSEIRNRNKKFEGYALREQSVYVYVVLGITLNFDMAMVLIYL